MNERNTFWNQAAKAGLVLGGVSVAYLALTYLLSLVNGEGFVLILMSIIKALLWVAKLFGCIYLMKLFITRYDSLPLEEGARRASPFSFGCLVAFLSALIYSAFYMAYTLYLAPDMIEQVVEVYKTMPQFTSDMIEELENMVPKMPTVLFFTNLVYCTLFGVIVSAFCSGRSKSSNPFNE